MRVHIPGLLLCFLGSLPGLEDFRLTAAIINMNPGFRHYPEIRLWQSTDRETGKRTMWVDLEKSGKVSVQLSDEQLQQMTPLIEGYISGTSVAAVQGLREGNDQPETVDFNGRHHWMKIVISGGHAEMTLSSSDYISLRIQRLQQPIIDLAYRILRPPPEDGQEPDVWYRKEKNLEHAPDPGVPAGVREPKR